VLFCALPCFAAVQMYQEDVLSGRLPAHPFQHFAAAMPISTQAFEALPDAAAAAEEQTGGLGRGRQQQQQRERGTGPVLLLPEATALVLGTQELEAGLGSSDGKRAGELTACTRFHSDGCVGAQPTESQCLCSTRSA
jgi:hypothetical protein